MTEYHAEPSEKVRASGTVWFMGMLFVAGYMSSTIYPSLINAITNIPELHGVSIGAVSSAEFLAFGTMLLIAGKFLPADSIRLVAGSCLVVQLATAYAVTALPPGLMISCRLLYGMASGVLVAISYLYIAGTSSPGRLAAIYTTGMVLLGVVWSLLGPAVVVPWMGYRALFLFLTFFSFVALVFIRLCPRRVTSLPDPDDAGTVQSTALTAPAILILSSVGLWGFFMIVFWVYADPIAQKLPGELVKNWLTISLVFQILGAAGSAFLVDRLPVFIVLAVGLCAFIAQLALILAGVGGLGFVICAAVYGFFGYFLVAFYIKALSKVDPSKSAVLYFPGVQILAASIGPMLVSQVVSETDLTSILCIDLAAIVFSLVALLCVTARKTVVNRVPSGIAN